MIEAAVTEKVDGLAVSAPDPEAISSAVRQAVDAGIPVDHAQLRPRLLPGPRRAHARRPDRGPGGRGGRQGARRTKGAKKLLCIIHEQGNIGLNDRCDGAKKGFGGDVENMQVKGTSDIQTSLTEIQSKLQADESFDAVLALNPDIAIAARDAVKGASSKATLATFDLSGDVIKGVAAGDILFAVDQQQYLQGYLPVQMLMLYKRNLSTVGGGQPVLTGPEPRRPRTTPPRSRSSRRAACADGPGGRDEAGGPAADGQRRRRPAGRGQPRHEAAAQTGAGRADRRARRRAVLRRHRGAASARSAAWPTGPTSPRRWASWPSSSRC